MRELAWISIVSILAVFLSGELQGLSVAAEFTLKKIEYQKQIDENIAANVRRQAFAPDGNGLFTEYTGKSVRLVTSSR
jgi:hypothetical protein